MGRKTYDADVLFVDIVAARGDKGSISSTRARGTYPLNTVLLLFILSYQYVVARDIIYGHLATIYDSPF